MTPSAWICVTTSDNKTEDIQVRGFNILVPLLDGFLAEHKAAMVIDRRVIIRALAGIDVTDELIALADEKLGAGQPAATPATPATPE